MKVRVAIAFAALALFVLFASACAGSETEGQEERAVSPQVSGLERTLIRVDLCPSWSPDGRKIVFPTRERSLDVNNPYDLVSGGGGDLTIINADGTGERRIASFRGDDPDWAPEGTEIPPYWSPAGGTEILYLDDNEGFRIVNLDGSESKAIAPGGSGGASWSPDGSEIVVSKAVGDISGGTVEFSSTLSLLDLNGGRPPRQIFGPVTDLIDDPTWSPRGRQIAFSDFDSINLVNTDGSGLQPIYTFRGGVGGGEPAWSPDGTQMVIEDGGDLYVIDAKGGDARQLTNISAAGGFDSCPDWSSDGQIAFSRSVGADQASRSAIFVINSDGSGGHQLTQTKEP